MKIQVGRNELLTAVQAVIGVVERRQTLPVLSNLLLDAQKDELVITGTDLELELVSRAVIKCTASGKTTVPARKLFDILFPYSRPTSILDVGCGFGAWLAVARQMGISEICAIRLSRVLA